MLVKIGVDLLDSAAWAMAMAEGAVGYNISSAPALGRAFEIMLRAARIA